MSPETYFRSNTGCISVPLWFPSFNASWRSPTLSDSVMGVSGHCNPWSRIFNIWGQRQWWPSNGSRISVFLNSEPYSTGDPACASIAFLRLNLWLFRTMKFFSAASVIISKQNKGFLGQGLCHPMISFMISNMLCRNVIMSLIARDSNSSCVGGAVALFI